MNFDIAEFLNRLLISFIPFLFAITVHELSHGLVAYLLGDDTAKNAGRLTLNPIKHLDIMGLLVLLVSQMIGWAKPVSVNYYKVSRVKYGPLMVAAAGPVSNALMAFISVILLKLALYLFTLDATEFIPLKLVEFILLTLQVSIRINVVLAIFNLIPIPPLDGGRIVHNLLPTDKAAAYAKIEPYGMIILLLLVFSGVTQEFLSPVMTAAYRALITLAVGNMFG